MTRFRFATGRPSSPAVSCPSHKKKRHGDESLRDRLRNRSSFVLSRRGRNLSSIINAALISKRPSSGSNSNLLDNLSLKRLQKSFEEGAAQPSLQNNAMNLVYPTKRFSEHKRKEEKMVGCPVYVMLPLDTVVIIERHGAEESQILKEKELERALDRFKKAGVCGIMVDIWWGIVERKKPKNYDFSSYKHLFEMVERAGLKIQAVMSFHAAGCNVGDTCEIPLPNWVTEIGSTHPDIYYTDHQGCRNQECLSLGCDHEPLFEGRTPIDVYRDFVDAFSNEFQYLFGEVITEITLGLGPAGELRYPSYPEGDGRWSFPGVGEFQCYDKYMLKSLRKAAIKAGHEEWASGGPHDAGHYNSKCWETEFFNCQSGTFDSNYGKFFLTWYSNLLICHADQILTAVSEILNRSGRPKTLKTSGNTHGSIEYEFAPAVALGIKVAGVHWWFKSRSHAAELTAGYYNTRSHNGYEPIIKMLKKHNASMSFTCVEMRDCEHPPESMCSPQGLLKQVIDTARRSKVPISGENALQRYDEYALSRITESAVGETAITGSLHQITFLRMGGLMFDNWHAFSQFLRRMKTPVLHS